MKSLPQRRESRLEAATRRREENPLELEGRLEFAGDLLRRHVERGGSLPKHQNLCMMFWFYVIRVPARWALESFGRSVLAALALVAFFGGILTLIGFGVYQIVIHPADQVLFALGGIVVVVLAVGLLMASALAALVLGGDILLWARRKAAWLLDNPLTARDFHGSFDEEELGREGDTSWRWLRWTFLTGVPLAMLLVYAIGHLVVLGCIWLLYLAAVSARGILVSQPSRWFFTKEFGHPGIRPWTIVVVGTATWVTIGSLRSMPTGAASVDIFRWLAYVVVGFTALLVYLAVDGARVEMGLEWMVRRAEAKRKQPSERGRILTALVGVGQVFKLLWTIIRVKKWGICPYVKLPDDLIQPQDEDDGEVIAPATA